MGQGGLKPARDTDEIERAFAAVREWVGGSGRRETARLILAILATRHELWGCYRVQPLMCGDAIP